MGLIFGYVAVFVSAVVLSTLRAVTTRVDGGRVLIVHILFLSAEAIRLWRIGDGPSPTLVFFAVVTVGSFLVRDWWLLSKYDESVTRGMVEESLGRLRIEFEADASGYALRTKAAPGTIALRALPGRRAAMLIRADPPAPKIELLSTLLVKQFEPLVPRLRIRLS